MNGDLNEPKSPTRPNKRSPIKDRIQVALLDDTVVAFDVETRCKGEVLYKKVNTHLNLDESEFFGLLFTDADNIPQWLDPLKSITKQIKGLSKVTFKFRVMFYTPDPNSLQEYTRYLFTLQVRRDLLDGRLYCSEDTGAMLASYIVQGELGDYDAMNHKEGYLAGFQFVPNQTHEVEQKIVDYHKSHRAETPADADHNMLEIARQLEMYGITLYLAQDSDNVDLSLAVYHMGILVFQNQHKINNISWANIRKLSFKKKLFLVKLYRNVGESNEIISFNLKSRNAAKGFWKICQGHHIFFRHSSSSTLKRQKHSFRRGSKYRYSGRTKKEISEEAASKYRSPTELSEVVDKNRSRLSGTAPKESLTSETPPQYHSLQSAEDERTSTSNDTELYKNENERHNELEEDPLLTIDRPLHEHNVITMKHQDTIDDNEIITDSSSNVPPSYHEVVSTEEEISIQEMPQEESVPEFEFDSFPSISMVAEKTAEGDDLSLDVTVHVTSTDREIEDEVESMFQKITSEYGSKTNGWQYNISSITTEELKSDEEERSDTEDKLNTENENETELSEADANEARKQEEGNEQIQVLSDKTEADEETEAQLREKVKALYLQSCSSTQAYDSDSDASAMTVDDEESAFEDDLSLPCSSSSSVSSIHKREGYLQELRKVKTSGKVYHMAKEILLTERTYVKDLEVLTVSFRNSLEKDGVLPDHLLRLLYDNIDPLYDFHCSLLAELEERLILWENSSTTEATRDSVQKIGDIMHRNMRQIKLYTSYIQRHGDVLIELEAQAKRSKSFEEVYKEFELGKVCYLSLNSFLLKPVQRLLYYKSMLERLTLEYGKEHPDAIDAKVAYEEVADACKQVEASMKNLENLHKMVELERDLVGVEDLVHPQRVFIREGCLHKICRKGPQPRMFFLLSDLLMYTSQGVTATNQFRARAQIPLRNIKVEEGGVELHGLYAFTVIEPSGKSFVVAANSPEEKYKWMEDLQRAINDALKKHVCRDCHSNRSEFILNVGLENNHLCYNCKEEINILSSLSPEDRLKYWQSNYPPPPVIKRSTADTDSDDEGSYSLHDQYSSLDRRHAHTRTISTRRVCWHRNTSISMKEYTLSIQNSLSGDLFRKFKNSSKWQKLWVVFTNFCLYFFKTYEDEAPLASLPLIGYSITKPLESEVHDDFTFKLQFKTHVYFFRAETEYAYERWSEVISSATRRTSKSRIRNRIAMLSSSS